MPYTAVTRVQIQTLLLAKVEGLPFWDPTEAADRFNEALRWWNLLTGTWKTKLLQATVANQIYYSVPGGMTFGFRVSWNGKALLPDSVFGLSYGRPQWRKETTASGGTVPSEPQIWVPVGINKFAIWPADAVVAHALELDGVAVTPVLVNPGDTLDIDESELGPLLDETIHLLAFKSGGSILKGTQAAHFRFLLAAADKNSRLKACSWMRKVLGLDRARSAKPITEVLDEAFSNAVAPRSN